MANADRKDAMLSYRFRVEIDSLQVAGFQEVTGLHVETEVEEYREGGVNSYVWRFPKQTKYPTMVLKRGITSVQLWNWYQEVIAGKFTRRHGAIILIDINGKDACRWDFFSAYPVKWNGPDFNAARSEVAVESVEFVYQNLKMALTGDRKR